MAERMTITLLAALLIGVAIYGAMADSCENALAPMLSCLDYLQDKATSPSSDCCSAFGNIVNVAAKCLCEAANGGSQFQVNQTRVESLPAVCNVDASPVVKACQNNGGTGSSSGGSSTTLSYFLLVSLPAILMYQFISAAV